MGGGSQMMYCKFNTETGEAHSFCNEAKDETYIECVMPPARVSEAQSISWQMEDERLIGYWIGSDDPLDAPASNEQIKRAQEGFEIAPIDVFGVKVDCDSRSDQFFKGTIATWDFRSLQPGVFEEVEGVRVVYWKASDNSVHPMTKEVLVTLYNQLNLNLAERAQLLWAAAQIHKTNGCTVRDLGSMELFLSALGEST